MNKPTMAPFRIGTAVLSEDLADGMHRQRTTELTWLRTPARDNRSDEPEEPEPKSS